MLSNRMAQALNEQIVLEGNASHLYLSMAAWCDRQALQGCAAFMFRQSDEERHHMLRLFHYISEVDGKALTPAIQEPPHDFPSVRDLFRQVYEHEKKVTQAIHSLIEMAYEEQDHATLNFLQWYVEEQREEEALMRTILDKIQLIGDGPQSLYYIDKEIEAINTDQSAIKAAD